ncbi:MAG TPA: GNAT family N-acetyltransferase [Acidimicrobiales bacterium]
MGTDGSRYGHGAAADGAPVVTVRPGAAADAPAAAQLHAGRITEGFLSFLGPGFLTRLYRRITRTPSSFLLVADASGDVVGFIAGSADLGGLYKSFLVRDGVAAGLAAAPRLVRGWRRVLETLRHGSGDGAGSGRGTELLAIAVDPAHEGRGVGKALVGAFLDRVAASGATEAYVVVGADNAGAIGLYGRAGFVAGEEFELHAGTRSLVMQWDRAAVGDGADS